MLSDVLRKLIKGPVGNNMANDEDDVLVVKDTLNRLGLFEEKQPNGFITRELDTAIKDFQRDHNLKVDGFLFPGGETEMALNGGLQQISDGIEKEELVPPNIPGTNIPDEGVPEQGAPSLRIPGTESNHPIYKIDPDIEVKPPVVDPRMQTDIKKPKLIIPRGRL